MNCAIVEAMLPQGVEVSTRHRSLAVREVRRKLTERRIGRCQVRAAPVPDHRVDEGVGLFGIRNVFGDLGTEIVGVGLRSVMAGRFGGDHRGQQLSLHAR